MYAYSICQIGALLAKLQYRMAHLYILKIKYTIYVIKHDNT